MDRGATKHEITVDDVPCEVWVGQSSKRVWIAYGSFRGERIEAAGSSASAALGQWAHRAEYAAKE